VLEPATTTVKVCLPCLLFCPQNSNPSPKTFRIGGLNEIANQTYANCVLLCSALWADTAENFDNVSSLSGLGWVFVNNSNPVGSTGWFQGNTAVFSSQNGAPDSYIAANFDNAAFGGNISDWLLSPEVVLSMEK